jgi:hypothetical protein
MVLKTENYKIYYWEYTFVKFEHDLTPNTKSSGGSERRHGVGASSERDFWYRAQPHVQPVLE